jgi:hypothetical protein
VTKRFLIAFAAQRTATWIATHSPGRARHLSVRERGRSYLYFGAGQHIRVICRHLYAYLLLSMLMKRTALFLKEQQLEKLQTLSEKTGAPVAELVRRAIDAYLLSRKKELK